MAKAHGGRRAKTPQRTRIGRRRNWRLVLVKDGGYFWSPEAEEMFFDALAASCNVKASAAEVGFTTFTVYRQRRLRPEFAAKWQAALEQGYARLEMALVEAAADSVSGGDFDADRPIPKMTAGEAVGLLKMHKAEVRGERAGRSGRFAAARDIEHFRESIMRKIEAVRRFRGSEGAASCYVAGADGGAGRGGAASAVMGDAAAGDAAVGGGHGGFG
jgi:hypothetical protein